MRRLNAIDAIAPAWEHTRALMYAPRRWKLMVKIGAVAFFAEMGGCNASFNGPNQAMGKVHHPLLIGLLVALGVGLLIVFLITFYVSSRLQFVLFEVVLRRDTRVRPIWRRYGAATWRWIGLKLLFFVAALLCMAPLIVPVVLLFIRLFRTGNRATSGDIGAAFVTVLLVILAAILVVLVVSCVYMLLADFGLPSMALEGTPLGETVRRVWALVKAEPWQVLGYVLMRILLNFAGAIGCEIFLALVALVLAVPLGIGGFGLWMALKHASLAGHVTMVAGWVVLGAIFAVLMFVVTMVVMGGLFVFLQAYGLYFLGGRYRLVGEYLEPAPVLVAPPPLPA